MLVPGFYTIISFISSDDKIEAVISLNHSHEIYKGHFPDRPVTPGVMQLQIVKELVEKATGREFLLSGISSAKYLNMMLPDACDTISIAVDMMARPAENQVRINAVMFGNEVVFFKLKATLTEK